MLEIHCQAAGVPVTTELLAGGVSEMVLRASAKARMLAIGRRGHTHAHDPHHLGRSFRSIAHRAHLPLVIGGDEERTVQRLLLAYDGREHTQPAVSWASLLQRTLSAEVIVVAVQENELDNTQEWLEEARGQLSGCRCLHRLGQPASQIIAVAEEHEVDLIVMGRYRHTTLLEGIVGSTVDRTLRGVSLPLLMV
jgi:nucleotide-binding universal stress UspA family protein